MKPRWSELRSRCPHTALGTLSWSGSLILGGHARRPECQLSICTVSPAGVRDCRTNCLPAWLHGCLRLPRTRKTFVAVLISQLQSGLRHVSILSSLLYFCELCGKTKVSMEHIQKGDQERNLDQIWLNSNLLIITLEGKCWPASVVGCFPQNCL